MNYLTVKNTIQYCNIQTTSCTCSMMLVTIVNKRLMRVVHLGNITQSVAVYSIHGLRFQSPINKELMINRSQKKLTNKCIKKLRISTIE